MHNFKRAAPRNVFYARERGIFLRFRTLDRGNVNNYIHEGGIDSFLVVAIMRRDARREYRERIRRSPAGGEIPGGEFWWRNFNR